MTSYLPPSSEAGYYRPLSSVSISAASFLCWEACIMFEAEVDLIWSKPNRSFIKWIYLLTRYVGLGAFVGNPFTGVGGSHPALSCREFLLYQVILAQTLITLVQSILMLRVYALYNRDPRIKSIFVFLTVAGTITGGIGLSSVVQDSQFNIKCGISSLNSSLTSFRFAPIAVDGIILLLTIIKCIHTTHFTVQPAPIIRLMLRDGMVAFTATVVAFVPTCIALIVSNGQYVSMVAPCFTAVLSCLGCRLIINMQQLSSSPSHQTEPNFMTSLVDIDYQLTDIYPDVP
ncbi:hypothetical protein BJ138DRAFT_1154634 [Hygrophoropsis aurantiaca]|uniref:Uncharacterized protein n=1 Tax=Hygrophoropsis aurantiaca TaxID=72124 RepID=A0ACB8A9K5_9AGAM|nr:hypothetical protein BJ138DRAFT_1154634 [Hygrophoropsis aurantiaca]